MLIQVINGFTERMQKAIAAQDYEELRVLDTACLRFMSEHLPPAGLNESEMVQLESSLRDLQSAYRSAVAICEAEREQLQTEIHSAGRGHRNAVQYLSVARNLGH